MSCAVSASWFLSGEANMHLVAIGLGATCVAVGAYAHFRGRSPGREDAFGLFAFGLLLTGMFLSRG